MFTTLVGFLVLLAFVLPGFIVTELGERRRATRRRGGDLDIVLRALWYSAAIHLVAFASGWTRAVYDDVRRSVDWEHHVTAVAVYALVVVFIVPTVLGLLLGRRLRTREQTGQLRAIDYALGGRDSRLAWDYLFGHFDAGFVVVQLKEVPEGIVIAPRDAVAGTEAGDTSSGSERQEWTYSTVVGKVGRESWATQTPSDRYDLYLEQVWPADPSGAILGDFSPARGLWVDASNIAAMYVIGSEFSLHKSPSAFRRLFKGLERRLRLELDWLADPDE